MSVFRTLLLVSKSAMLEEARVLYDALEQDWPGGATIVVAGDLTTDSVIVDSLHGANFAMDSPKPAIFYRSQIWMRIARYGLLRTFWTVIAIVKRERNASRLLTQIKPDALIVFEDRAIDPEMTWLKVATSRKLPSIMIRYASSSIESDVWTRHERTPYSLDHGCFAWARRLFARRHPFHALKTDTGRHIFFSLWDSLALALCRMTNTYPWIAGGGMTNLVALQGKIDYDEAIRHTNMPRRFCITGQPTWDRLAAQRHSLPAKSAEDTDSCIAKAGCQCVLVCALPQWGEHLQMSWDRHLKLIEQLFVILHGLRCKIILSLHPKARTEDYRPMAEKYKLLIADKPLSEILPQADVFIASWSSTLRWAAMLGIPSINLDWATQRYSLFAELRSLLLSENPSDLEPQLSAIIRQDSARKHLGQRLKEESVAFGTIDGFAVQRITSLIESLIKNHTHE